MREPTLLDRVVAMASLLAFLLQPLGFFVFLGAGALLWPVRGLDPWVLGLWLAAAAWFLLWAGFRWWAPRWGRRRWPAPQREPPPSSPPRTE
jgi:hypothetical protein